MIWLYIWMIGFTITMVVLPLIVDKEDISPVASIIFCVSWPIVWVEYALIYIKTTILGADDDDNEMGP